MRDLDAPDGDEGGATDAAAGAPDPQHPFLSLDSDDAIIRVVDDDEEWCESDDASRPPGSEGQQAKPPVTEMPLGNGPFAVSSTVLGHGICEV